MSTNPADTRTSAMTEGAATAGEAAENPAATGLTPVAGVPPAEPFSRRAVQFSLYHRVYDWLDLRISRLSVRNNFWHRVCSFVFLPLAFSSGIHFRRIEGDTFAAILPFRRFNKNWYNGMGGAALLAASEVAGGWLLFRACGAAYTVVCKHLDYRFLRPCLGAAVYTIKPRENLEEQLAHGKEFNLTLDLEVLQQGGGNRRVGRCVAIFHLTPKSQFKAKSRQERNGGRKP